MSKATKYRKKPVVIEAMRWDGEMDGDIEGWLGESFNSWRPHAHKATYEAVTPELSADELAVVERFGLDKPEPTGDGQTAIPVDDSAVPF